jgi:peptidoglycan/xylan/chitin deacetylase (PgdA/CDA1 family)
LWECKIDIFNGALRYKRPLLDTAEVLAHSKGLRRFMFVSRFLLICSLSLLAFAPLHANDAISAQAPEKDKPAAPGAPSVTFNFVHVDGPYIAMTFDDGPHAALTPKLLGLLAAHHIKATFFVIGQNAAEHPEIVARAAQEGHEIGNHSWSHPNFAKMSDEGVRRELRKTDDVIRAATGTRPTLMRPPYGSITARQKKWIAGEFGYKIILWDVDPLDWKRPGPAAVCNRILRATRPGSIVLSHDIHAGTIEAMPATLNQLEAKGFKFVTVSELISMARPETPKPAPAERANSPSTNASPPPASTTEPAATERRGRESPRRLTSREAS